jgi:hypothetical protein
MGQFEPKLADVKKAERSEPGRTRGSATENSGLQQVPPMRGQKSSRHKRIATPSHCGQGPREMLSDRSRAEHVAQPTKLGL